MKSTKQKSQQKLNLKSEIARDIRLYKKQHRQLKVYDTVANGTGISASTTNIYRLCAPAQGNGLANRVGDKIVYTRIDLKVTITAADSLQHCRVVLFRWLPNYGTAPPTRALLLDNGPSGGIDTYSMITYSNRKQFKILRDWSVTMVLSGSSGNQDVFWGTINLGDQASTFTTGTQNNDNGLYIFAFSDSAVATDPGFYMNSRVYFAEFED